MDGLKSLTWKVIKACFSFSGIALNHFVLSLVLFHRFTLVICVISLFIWSRMVLLMMPILDLHGLISLQVGLFMRSSLWSFCIVNEFLGIETSIGSSSSSFLLKLPIISDHTEQHHGNKQLLLNPGHL